MVRQDIFATLSDDVLGEKCSTTSQRGKVKCIELWVNTDIAKDGLLRFCIDKEKRIVEVGGRIPEKWEVNITREKNEVE